MPKSRLVVVYGALWCEDSTRIAQFLKGNKVPYHAIAIDNDEILQSVVQKISGKNKETMEIPVVVFPNGDFMVNPRRRVLLGKLIELEILP